MVAIIETSGCYHFFLIGSVLLGITKNSQFERILKRLSRIFTLFTFQYFPRNVDRYHLFLRSNINDKFHVSRPFRNTKTVA